MTQRKTDGESGKGGCAMTKEITEEQITSLMQDVPRAEEVDRLRAETEQLRDILRRVSVQPDRDRTVKISFFSEGDSVSWSVHPQTSWAREVLAEFEQDRHRALKANP